MIEAIVSKGKSKEERISALFNLIRKGVRASFRKFLKEAVANNKKLVVMRNGKVVMIPARQIQEELRAERQKEKGKA